MGMLFKTRRAVRRFSQLVLVAICLVIQANTEWSPGSNSSEVIGSFCLFSEGEAADSHGACFIETISLGPEPSNPVL